MKAIVTKNEFITNDVILLDLKLETEINFKPGQFMSITLDVNNEQITRSYSILRRVGEREIEFCIKILPEGKLTPTISKLKIGEEIYIDGPFGFFTYSNEGNKEVFIGTGTGIVPFYLMIKENLKLNSNKEFQFIAGYRFKEDILFDDEFKEIEKENKNFKYIVTLSREDDFENKGYVYEFIENIDSETNYYICGLKDMIKTTKNLLKEKGADKSKIHIEIYT